MRRNSHTDVQMDLALDGSGDALSGRRETRIQTMELPGMRTILIDDYPPFLMALAAMLRQQPGIDVVGEAHNGSAGLKLAAELKPELVLVDFSMPDMSGADVTRALKKTPNPPKVVVVSFHAAPEYRDMALQAGADGYVVKSEIHRDLMPLLPQLMA